MMGAGARHVPSTFVDTDPCEEPLAALGDPAFRERLHEIAKARESEAWSMAELEPPRPPEPTTHRLAPTSETSAASANEVEDSTTNTTACNVPGAATEDAPAPLEPPS